MFFEIFVDITNDKLKHNIDIEDFNTAYNFGNKTNSEKAITLTYFVFTSLSTTGFGDLYPMNEYE
jgi:hypothetical protein